MKTMVAAILAGGLGTRLRSVVPDKPKVLAPVHGRPFIEYLLDQLVREGVQTTVLCTGYMGEQVEEALGSTYRGISLRYSREHKPLGTGGALRLALPLFSSEDVLIMNGDSYCDTGISEFVAFHRARCSPASILLAETPDTRRFGRVDVDSNGSVVRFREKAEVAGSGWINAGIYLLKRHFIETIPENQAISIEREIFPEWIGRGLAGYCSNGRLVDIGIPDAYAQAKAEFDKPTRF